MVFAMFIGMGLGVTGGLLLGGQLFKAHAHVHTEKYKQLDLDADTEEEVDPNIGKVTGEYRDILKYAPKWTTWPDFEQVRWMNSTIEWLWPNLARAIVKMATDIVKPILEDVVANQPMLDEIVIQELDLGPYPPRLAGVKVYDTKDDEVILEAPLQWGSGIKVHVLARVRVGPASIYIPVKVEDLQLSANARITIRPLVDTLPCLGAISISLTESPFVDLSLRAINSMDLLSVPFVHDAMMMAIKMVTESIVVYPNQIPVPLMENSGLPKPPSGMLEITIQRCANLKSQDVLGKGDPYVKVSVHTMGTVTDKHGKEHEIVAKEAPGHATTVKSGKDPEFNEHFRILIPELNGKHKLAFRVLDRDLLGQDDVQGEYDVRLDSKSTSRDTEFLRTGEEVQAQFNLQPESGTLDRKAGKAAGELFVSMQYTKFFNAEAEEGDEDDPGKAMEKLQKRQAPTVVNDTTKGVLMVEVPRCTDLPLVGSTCDSYIELKLTDPDGPEGPDIRKGEVIFNERSPRFRCEQDFVYVSATSILTLTVYDQPGLFELSNVLKLGRKKDKPLGKVRIHVKDVAKAGRIKDAFPLQDADQGDMHVLLQWTSVERDD